MEELKSAYHNNIGYTNEVGTGFKYTTLSSPGFDWFGGICMKIQLNLTFQDVLDLILGPGGITPYIYRFSTEWNSTFFGRDERSLPLLLLAASGGRCGSCCDHIHNAPRQADWVQLAEGRAKFLLLALLLLSCCN